MPGYMPDEEPRGPYSWREALEALGELIDTDAEYAADAPDGDAIHPAAVAAQAIVTAAKNAPLGNELKHGFDVLFNGRAYFAYPSDEEAGEGDADEAPAPVQAMTLDEARTLRVGQRVQVWASLDTVDEDDEERETRPGELAQVTELRTLPAPQGFAVTVDFLEGGYATFDEGDAEPRWPFTRVDGASPEAAPADHASQLADALHSVLCDMLGATDFGYPVTDEAHPFHDSVKAACAALTAFGRPTELTDF